jgi:uncharacterized RDD family membrane protein YckC
MAHAAHDLIVDSVTGVDVSLAIAGTGARALAFLIDLLIRTILVVAWYVVATLIYNGAWSLEAPRDPQSTWYIYVALPATGIYTLYHLVLEIVMRGRTPGKRMVGVRLVTRNGAIPSLAAYVVRNVFRLVDSFPLGYGVGLVTSIVTREHVRVGDLAAGTLLVYENRAALKTEHLRPPGKDGSLDIATTELIGELLGRWQSLDVQVRARLARSLLARAAGTATEEPATGEPATDAALRERLEHLAGIGGFSAGSGNGARSTRPPQ